MNPGNNGEIPQSTALAEASQGQDSLAEVFARDPEGYSRQDRDIIVQALRDQRARVAAAEAAGIKPRTAKSAEKVPLSNKATKDLSDMGL